jgi:hypothetical protein
MKSNKKNITAKITSALTEAALVKSSRKKIMKKIDATAKKLTTKINKRLDSVIGKTHKLILKIAQNKRTNATKKIPK